MLARARRWWRRPVRIRLAGCLLACSALGWPVSAATFARDEPPTVLGLSWLAISLTCLDVLFTSQVHEQRDKE